MASVDKTEAIRNILTGVNTPNPNDLTSLAFAGSQIVTALYPSTVPMLVAEFAEELPASIGPMKAMLALVVASADKTLGIEKKFVKHLDLLRQFASDPRVIEFVKVLYGSNRKRGRRAAAALGMLLAPDCIDTTGLEPVNMTYSVVVLTRYLSSEEARAFHRQYPLASLKSQDLFSTIPISEGQLALPISMLAKMDWIKKVSVSNAGDKVVTVDIGDDVMPTVGQITLINTEFERTSYKVSIRTRINLPSRWFALCSTAAWIRNLRCHFEKNHTLLRLAACVSVVGVQWNVEHLLETMTDDRKFRVAGQLNRDRVEHLIRTGDQRLVRLMERIEFAVTFDPECCKKFIQKFDPTVVHWNDLFQLITSSIDDCFSDMLAIRSLVFPLLLKIQQGEDVTDAFKNLPVAAACLLQQCMNYNRYRPQDILFDPKTYEEVVGEVSSPVNVGALPLDESLSPKRPPKVIQKRVSPSDDDEDDSVLAEEDIQPVRKRQRLIEDQNELITPPAPPLPNEGPSVVSVVPSNIGDLTKGQVATVRRIVALTWQGRQTDGHYREAFGSHDDLWRLRVDFLIRVLNGLFRVPLERPDEIQEYYIITRHQAIKFKEEEVKNGVDEYTSVAWQSSGNYGRPNSIGSPFKFLNAWLGMTSGRHVMKDTISPHTFRYAVSGEEVAFLWE